MKMIVVTSARRSHSAFLGPSLKTLRNASSDLLSLVMDAKQKQTESLGLAMVQRLRRLAQPHHHLHRLHHPPRHLFHRLTASQIFSLC